MTDDASKNRDPRTAPILAQASSSPNNFNVFVGIESHEDLGFIADMWDKGHDLDGVNGDDPVDIQIKPHPNGYQIDYWYTDDDGNREQGVEHINLGSE